MDVSDFTPTKNDSAAASPMQIDATRLAYGVDEFARVTGLSRAFMWEQIRLKKIHVIRRGRRTLITAEAAREFLAG